MSLDVRARFAHTPPSGAKLHLRVGLFFAVVGVCFLLPGAASATPTYTHDCSDAAVWDIDSCERLTYIAEQTDVMVAALAAMQTSVDLVATHQTEDRHRLDLIWWGAWALVGLVFVGLIAERWYRAWGIEGKVN